MSKETPAGYRSGMALWWFYLVEVRRYFIRRWRRKLPAWTDMIEGTRVLTKSASDRFFPGATLWVETVVGIPKSYVVYMSPSAD